MSRLRKRPDWSRELTRPLKILGAITLRARALIVLHMSLSLAFPALGRDLQSDTDVAKAIIAECAAIYHTSRPCACPEDLARNGTRCGGRSAHNRLEGASTRCYVKDVSPREIADHRAGKKDFVADCAPLP